MNTRQNDFYTSNPQRYAHVKIGFRKDGTLTAVHESSISDSGAPGQNARAPMSFGGGAYSPFNTTRCLNLKNETQSAYTSSGKITGSQTSPYDWDAMTIAEQIIAEKLGMDPTDIALKNVHGPASQKDPGAPPSLVQCIEKGRKAMNWKWHPAGTRLPDGRLHGWFPVRPVARHAKQPYTRR
jgi:xanthine dehydrogenase molybdenum-binding subunit